MRKILPLIVIIFLSFGIVFAQSPFGDLKEEKRLHVASKGLTLKDYKETKDNLGRLNDLYERAYGTRKDELQEQIFL